MAALWWLNNDFWEGLTHEEKRIVYDAFQALKDVTRAAPMRNAIAAYQAFRDAGGGSMSDGRGKEAVPGCNDGHEGLVAEQYGDEWLNRCHQPSPTLRADGRRRTSLTVRRPAQGMPGPFRGFGYPPFCQPAIMPGFPASPRQRRSAGIERLNPFVQKASSIQCVGSWVGGWLPLFRFSCPLRPARSYTSC
ncbi:MAG: hypothetical protein R3D03_01605 [Geminicoccaceae bacterium]